MFGMGVTELLIILAIVLLLFGPKRIKTLGSDLGSAIKGFRTAVKEEDKKPTVERNIEDTDDSNIIEGEINQQKQTSNNSDNNV